MYHPPLSLQRFSFFANLISHFHPPHQSTTSPLSLPPTYHKSIAAHLMVFKMGAREPEFPVAPSALAVPVAVNSPYKK